MTPAAVNVALIVGSAVLCFGGAWHLDAWHYFAVLVGWNLLRFAR